MDGKRLLAFHPSVISTQADDDLPSFLSKDSQARNDHQDKGTLQTIVAPAEILTGAFLDNGRSFVR